MLKISTKGRYALRIMLDLARHTEDGPVSLRTVAERQNITLKYMESIMSLLLREELVISTRGKSGGYKLTRKVENYSVYEILRAAEGNLAPVQCLAVSENDCPMHKKCPTLPMWVGLEKLVREYLESYTLDQLSDPDNPHPLCNARD